MVQKNSEKQLTLLVDKPLLGFLLSERSADQREGLSLPLAVKLS